MVVGVADVVLLKYLNVLGMEGFTLFSGDVSYTLDLTKQDTIGPLEFEESHLIPLYSLPTLIPILF